MPVRVCVLALFVMACASARSPNQPDQVDAPVADAADDIDAPVLPPDANTCATQPCDILTQCGCGATEACDIDNSDNIGTACRTVFTPGTETSTCTNPTRCDKGFVCLFDGGSNVGTCKRYCDADSDCGTPRGKCIFQITSGGQPIPDVPKACSSNCDPTNSAAGGCPSTHKCGLFTVDTTNIVDCSVAGNGTQGAACNNNDALCAANFLCTTVGASNACRRICNRTNNTGCVGSQTCLGFATPFSVGGTEYGVCN
jgi:hypothetical protein